jgi:hypothetical protein
MLRAAVSSSTNLSIIFVLQMCANVANVPLPQMPRSKTLTSGAAARADQVALSSPQEFYRIQALVLLQRLPKAAGV